MFRHPPVCRPSVALAAVCVILAACDDFSPAPIEFAQEDLAAIGDVRTVELHGRVLASLPETPPAVDPAKAELGRSLFWDPILSGDRDMACATCHLPELAYTDGQRRSIGVGGRGRGTDRIVGHTGLVRRNAMDDGRGETIARFLRALHDPDFDRSEPAEVPSGLAVGGSLQR